jgi:hypothetical protein
MMLFHRVGSHALPTKEGRGKAKTQSNTFQHPREYLANIGFLRVNAFTLMIFAEDPVLGELIFGYGGSPALSSGLYGKLPNVVLLAPSLIGNRCPTNALLLDPVER